MAISQAANIIPILTPILIFMFFGGIFYLTKNSRILKNTSKVGIITSFFIYYVISHGYWEVFHNYPIYQLGFNFKTEGLNLILNLITFAFLSLSLLAIPLPVFKKKISWLYGIAIGTYYAFITLYFVLIALLSGWVAHCLKVF